MSDSEDRHDEEPEQVCTVEKTQSESGDDVSDRASVDDDAAAVADTKPDIVDERSTSSSENARVVESFEGFGLEDLPVHVSSLERQLQQARADDFRRRLPTKAKQAYEPLEAVLKPRVCRLQMAKDEYLAKMVPRQKAKDTESTNHQTGVEPLSKLLKPHKSRLEVELETNRNSARYSYSKVNKSEAECD